MSGTNGASGFSIADPKVQIIFGAARALLASVGGIVAGLGYVNVGTWDTATGAALVIAAVGWSAWEKLRAAKAP